MGRRCSPTSAAQSTPMARLVAFEYQAGPTLAGGLDTTSQLALGAPPAGNFGGGAPGPGGGGLFSVHLSQMDMYDVPNRRIVNRRVAGPGYLRTGALRAPMDPSTFFALEGMMDELAYTAKLDPYEFRKRNISHRRWLGVLKAATDAAKWTPRVAASKAVRCSNRHRARHWSRHASPTAEPGQSRHVCRGGGGYRGEQETRPGRGETRLRRDGRRARPSIRPSSRVRSWACRCTEPAWPCAKRCNSIRRTSRASTGIPIRRSASVSIPGVTPIVVQQIHEQSSGAGEEMLPAVVAAIGNAFFDATGVRIRRYPLTPRRVLAALKSTRRSETEGAQPPR